ncbi:MAG: DUF1549 and DUF1553 domain-containing protein, partial [Opitutaceae bacterium]
RYAHAWTYRDWVIDALNRDLPYDEFIRQQIAADMIPGNGPQNIAALGFLTVGERFSAQNDVINDRIDVVTKGFLGLTVTCARCHDHMFDPIPTKDYYALHGVFASTTEPEDLPAIHAGTEAEIADYEREREKIEQQNRDHYYRYAGDLQQEFFRHVQGYLMLPHLSRPGASPEEQAKRVKLINDLGLKNGLVQTFSVRRPPGDSWFNVVRESRDDPIFSPFREFAKLEPADFAAKAARLVAQIRTGALSSGNRMVQLNPIVVAAFAEVEPQTLDDVAGIYGALFAPLESQREAFVAASAQTQAGAVAGFSPALAEILASPFDLMPAWQASTKNLRKFDPKLGNSIQGSSGPFWAKLNELDLTHPGAPGRAMRVADAERIKNSPVLLRGQAESPGEIVPRRFLEVLSPDYKPVPFAKGSGRLELAGKIASPTNPLTARVAVNRVWMHHFGEGLVRTVDDLGTLGEAPSHPALLDFLAGQFITGGWSFKKLHKTIMLSRVYQQSSRTNPRYEEIDPENRLLWRANIRRLDFEAVRDSLLFFSGKLDCTLGGRPVNLTEEPYSYRRSVYGYIDRGQLSELMQSFDFSDPTRPQSKRNTTVVPPQALFLMNNPLAIEVARSIAAREDIASTVDDAGRVAALYQVLFQRPANQAELALGLEFIATDASTPPDAAPAADAGALERPKPGTGYQGRYAGTFPIYNRGERVVRKPLTGWEAYIQALLFSNEASYIN